MVLIFDNTQKQERGKTRLQSLRSIICKSTAVGRFGGYNLSHVFGTPLFLSAKLSRKMQKTHCVFSYNLYLSVS